MSDPAPPIAYASAEDELPSDRLLRRIVAFSAMIYGGDALLDTALHVALARGWVASPSSMGWGFYPNDLVITAAQTVVMFAMLMGGVLGPPRERDGQVLLVDAGGSSGRSTPIVEPPMAARADPVAHAPAAGATNGRRNRWRRALIAER